MTPPQDDDDRERPSWREIDKLRDRSSHTTPEPRPRGGKAQAEKARQAALKQAEALFAGKRALPEYRKALYTLETHHGTPKFAATAKKFLTEYGLPEEWGALILLLDYPDPAVTVTLLERLTDLVKDRSRVEQQGFKGKLRSITLSTGNLEVKKTAACILATL